MEKIRVFFIPRWFPVPDDPLWGLFVLRHAQSVQRYADVYVMHIDKHRERSRCKKPIITDKEGIPVLYYFYPDCKIPVLGKIILVFRMLAAWHRGWRHAMQIWGKPDINHVHILTRMGLLAMLIKYVYGIPYVVTEHWSRYLPESHYRFGLSRKLVTRLVIRRAGAVMPVTHDLAKAMLELGFRNNNYQVIHNAVDTLMFKPSKAPPANGKLNLLHISTFDDRAKNISGLLRVMARVFDENRDVILRLIGDGDDFERMKKMAVNLSLPDEVVRFEGAMEAPDIAKHLTMSDFLILFSHYENMPVVINEAMACGIPVISTHVGGIAEMVDDTCGYLIEAGDEDGLLELIRQIVHGEAKVFNKDHIRKKAETLFSMASIGQQIHDIYIGLIH